jgi:putative phosphoesterase
LLATGEALFPTTVERRFEPPLTIGVVADTHVYRNGGRRFSPEIPALFARGKVGLILHAGDVCTVGVLRALGEVAPVLAVVGNNDEPALRDVLPESIEFAVGRFAFVLVHGDRLNGAPVRTARTAARRFAGKVDCVVYGHSHIPMQEMDGETLLFNPGSATDRRWQAHFGIGLIVVEPDKVVPDLILYDDPRYLTNVEPR